MSTSEHLKPYERAYHESRLPVVKLLVQALLSEDLTTANEQTRHVVERTTERIKTVFPSSKLRMPGWLPLTR